jgi:carbamoyl-phosphate synthase large subunit
MGIEIIGVDIDAIQITEDRQKFRDLMERIGIDQARSRVAKSLLEAKEIAQELGGHPGRDPAFVHAGRLRRRHRLEPGEFDRMVTRGLELSPVHEVLIEECLFGWKEYELELLRDATTTSSSSARSRTWTRWASTRAIR